ncbi:hypothetical protein Sango_2103500 [Sesamum angolense]|uniref:Integrase zinc-binding domain-containing protein n=1 Tax=Sesamum angolense TaxID=2727404 RepID=A0AAE1WBT6_9LAMI|nr:hypothetical protein Sango_2103500 [Sesamum angolense]
MVLGGDWLRRYSPVEYDYVGMAVTVSRKDVTVLLQALSQRSELQMVSAQSMSKLIKQGAYGFVGQVHAICGEQLSFPVSSTAIDTLLESYADIFQEPQAVTVVIPNWVTDIVRSYDGDDEFLPVIQAKSIDDAAYPMFSLQGGVLRKEGRICVGKNTDVRQRIVRVLQDSSIGGHSGINGMYKRVRSMFFWGKLKEDVVRWIRSCDVCQKAKAERVPYPGLLQPLPVPHQAWSSVSMDFFEGLPKSEGRNCIMVVVDRFSKYSHFLALTHPFSAELVA